MFPILPAAGFRFQKRQLEIIMFQSEKLYWSYWTASNDSCTCARVCTCKFHSPRATFLPIPEAHSEWVGGGSGGGEIIKRGMRPPL